MLTPPPSLSHHPASPPSVKALAMLRQSLAAPYPPSTPGAPPLEFNLEVVEAAPTPDQLRTILAYVPDPSYAAFLSAPAPGEAQSAPGVAELGARDPGALKWPVVVDWHGGRASIGDVDGVAHMLEALRQRRDGELTDDGVAQPGGWFW